MIQKHRIATNIGKDQKVTVEIQESFDLMEILSLKFSQKDIYSSGNCAAYGVVVGRVSANSGFGIPNARVSIFIPQSDLDVNDPVISALYPYQTMSDKDVDGYRYNLLPSRQQHGGHTPTGTFPDQEDILTREEVLEVFESYYSFTVKTNSAGDFMIWGVPLGTQTVHVDIDLSDIGCFSLRPYDFIKKGFGADHFDRFYKFKSSIDIDGLPQIVTFDKSIEVYPFWGNEELCQIGITRTDFDLSEKGIKIEPISLILMSSITDDNSHAVKRSGKIRRDSGYKCKLQTTTGKIECVRETGGTVYGSDGVTRYPELEFLNLTEVIDENGVAMVVLPMNMEYVYTNVFGEEETTNDTNKGIPTTAIARFRFSLDFDSPKHGVGKYLVPNIREFNPNASSGSYTNEEYNEGMISSYQFSDVFEDYITVTPPSGATISVFPTYDTTVKNHKTDLMLGTIKGDGVPEDYFYKFIYGKVYTVSSFQGTHSESSQRDAFLGIKEIRPNTEEDCSSNANYFPTNFGFKNRIKFSLIISEVLLFLQFIFSIIIVKFGELLGGFFYSIASFFYSIYLGWPFKWRPFDRFSEQLYDLAYRIQDRYTQQLPLTIYPDCEECTRGDDVVVYDASYANNYCKVGEIKMTITHDASNVILYVLDNQSSAYFINGALTPSFLNAYFPEMAKDSDGLCANSDILSYGNIGDMSSQPHWTGATSDNTARFFTEIYGIGYQSTPPTIPVITGFTSFIAFFSSELVGDDDIYVPITYLPGGYTYAPGNNIKFTYNQWNNLTGIDYYQSAAQIDGMQVVLKIYDRNSQKVTTIPPTETPIPTGCQKYDKVYNEKMVFTYLWGETEDYGDVTIPLSPPDDYESGYKESLLPPGAPYDYLLSTIIGSTSSYRLPYKKSWPKIPNATYDRRTKSGLSEFRDGVFTIIPVIKGYSQNTIAIQEWYRRKRIGLFFCGGVVNYSFIDNWLNGLLYFFKFDKRVRWDNENVYDLNQRATQFPRGLLFYHVFDKIFYYRSTPYNGTLQSFIGQKNMYDGFMEILHPTTFYDVGVRDEFLYEICTDPRVDPTCSVVRDIHATSYQDPANVVEFAINYRLDSTNDKFDVDDFFSGTQYGSNIKIFDGDITQLMSINCETGIEAFDMDSPHYYMYSDTYMDPEDPYYQDFFKDSTHGYYGPTPIDLKFDAEGSFIRGCLNTPGKLGDYAQRVPFYLWNKNGIGFGPFGRPSESPPDSQKWDRSKIAVMRLQGIYSISGSTEISSNYKMADGVEEYLLRPMTIDHKTYSVTGSTVDMLERFEKISYIPPDTILDYIEGDLWLYVTHGSLSDPQAGDLYVVVNKTWTKQDSPDAFPMYFKGYRESFIPQTVQNYIGNEQVLSTPFLFYFGLRPEKTALDILIKYFGPKGAFPSPESTACINPDVTPAPSPTPAASLLPYPVTTPTPTPTPSASTMVYYYQLQKCVDQTTNWYATSSSLLSKSTPVAWQGDDCTPTSLYVVKDITTVEWDYSHLGYHYIGPVTASMHGACFDCHDVPVTPTAPPSSYVQILLARKGSAGEPDPATSMCGLIFNSGDNVKTVYIKGTTVTPDTAYLVYNESTFNTTFNGGDKYWGIAIPDEFITYTVFISSSGSLNATWVSC
jgi:hypothetical protein